MMKSPFLFVAVLLASLPARASTWSEGVRSLHALTLKPGIEVSRNFFHLTRPGGKPSERWGRLVEGDERNVGLDEKEAEAALKAAREKPGSQFRWCNLHVHRKDAVLRLQKERNEPAPHGNLSFPPSGADVSLSLVSEESWGEWKITGETAIGVLDSYGLWLFRELAGERDPRRTELYRKHGFTPAELAAEKGHSFDASELGRYEYMKAVNARPREAAEIRGLPEYRLLVLRYAVHESVEVVFLPLEEALAGEGCRGF